MIHCRSGEESVVISGGSIQSGDSVTGFMLWRALVKSGVDIKRLGDGTFEGRDREIARLLSEAELITDVVEVGGPMPEGTVS